MKIFMLNAMLCHAGGVIHSTRSSKNPFDIPVMMPTVEGLFETKQCAVGAMKREAAMKRRVLFYEIREINTYGKGEKPNPWMDPAPCRVWTYGQDGALNGFGKENGKSASKPGVKPGDECAVCMKSPPYVLPGVVRSLHEGDPYVYVNTPIGRYAVLPPYVFRLDEYFKEIFNVMAQKANRAFAGGGAA